MFRGCCGKAASIAARGAMSRSSRSKKLFSNSCSESQEWKASILSNGSNSDQRL